MIDEPYSARVRALFADPVHAGCVDGGTTIRVDDQGVSLCLCATSEAGRVETLRFKAWGCPHVIAAAEAFCAGYEGRLASELLEFSASDLMKSLSVPLDKTGRILVLEDAVRALGAALRDASN